MNFVSFDIETDGLRPGQNSMLQLGCAYFPDDGNSSPAETFEVNLRPLSRAHPHPKTMQWWEKHPEAWEAHRKPPLFDAADAMALFMEWYNGLQNRPVMAAWPGGFDWPFVWHYLRAAGYKADEMCGNVVCIKSYAMAIFGKDEWFTFRKNHMPKNIRDASKPGLAHTALEDAIAQGKMFRLIIDYGRDMRTRAVVAEEK